MLLSVSLILAAAGEKVGLKVVGAVEILGAPSGAHAVQGLVQFGGWGLPVLS